MDSYNTINEVLVKLFNEIMHIEEKAIITEEFKDISNNDMHIIESIGKEEPKNMSTIAKSLSVTVGTLTIAINNLVKKGYAIAYAADAKVYHSHNYSALQQFHRNFDLGVSQAEHPEIFANVPSEGEGIRLVKKSLAYLVKTGHIWLIPQLVIQSGAKYAGYFLGKRYWKLPHRLVMACTMSPWYWKQK